MNNISNKKSKLMKNFRYLTFIGLMVFFISCSQEDIEPEIIWPENLGKGFFVLNQGNFTAGNASLSFYRYDSAKMENSIFFRRNGVPLGDVAHSLTFWRNYAFIVVNNSSTVWVINSNTSIIAGKLSGFHSPRFIQVISSEKAYVSDLLTPGISVFNTSTLQAMGTISTGKSTEQLLLYKDKVFAANWSDYNQSLPNNTIQIVDVVLDRLTDSIVVVKEPNSMVLDKNNKLWVLCSGGYMNEEIPALFRINAENNQIESRYDFSSLEMSPEQLRINASLDTLYFLNNGVFRMAISEAALPLQPLIAENQRNFFSLALEPQSKEILVTDVGNYTQTGFVFRFRPNGMLIDSVGAGVIPGYIGFN
jgi:DNA-binding beta-propeller fold protein YncE